MCARLLRRRCAAAVLAVTALALLAALYIIAAIIITLTAAAISCVAFVVRAAAAPLEAAAPVRIGQVGARRLQRQLAGGVECVGCQQRERAAELVAI